MQCGTLACTSSLRTMMRELQPFNDPPIEPLPELLQKLKCSNCELYLSCPPVFETPSGENICGRCPPPPEGTRSKLFEIVAEMVSFPCRYARYGCLDVAKFAAPRKHEDTCEFKPVACPIATDGSCDWVGPKGQVYNHCDTNHVSKIIHNTSEPIKINAGKNMLTAYILQALGRLYLVHIKVCVTSRRIFHSMQYLGKNQEDSIFRVDIHKGNDKISKMSKVQPEGDLKFNENNCMAVSFNSLMDVLGPFDEIHSKIWLYNKCAECCEHVRKLVFHGYYGWICMDCVPPVSKELLRQLSKPISRKELIARQKKSSKK